MSKQKAYLKEVVRWSGATWTVNHNPCGTVSVFRNGRKMPSGIAAKVIKHGDIKKTEMVAA